MSFSRNVKIELCKTPVNAACCAVAESYGALLYCHTFSGREIRIVTENSGFAARMRALFAAAFGLEFDAVREPKSDGGKISLLITDADKISRIIETFGFAAGKLLSHHVNLGVLEDDCCRAGFLRGAFLAGGSVTDPERSYHLELATPHRSVSREMSALLREAGFAPKSVTRASLNVIYFKQSGAIEDFLTFVGAPSRALELMSIKVEKDLRSGVNRRVNCDIANVTKTTNASERQVNALEKLVPLLGELPDKLRETAQLRLEYPELSLVELGEMCVPPVTKSCLNHRMRKLEKLAAEVGDVQLTIDS